VFRAKSYLNDTLVTRKSYIAIAEGYTSWRNKPWPIALISRPGAILDLGSGACINGVEAAKRTNSYVVCLDYSPSMIRIARKISERKNVPADQIVADMSRLPFRENSFNTVLAIASIHHVPPIHIDSLARQLRALLMPHGLLVVTIWSWRQPRFAAQTLLNMLKTLLGFLGYPRRYVARWKTRETTYERVYYLYTLGEMTCHLQKAGLKILSKGYYSPSKSTSQNVYVVATKPSSPLRALERESALRILK
jgi:ubiquinone/menaquinone biosynthesis C-methylase UbiE